MGSSNATFTVQTANTLIRCGPQLDTLALCGEPAAHRWSCEAAASHCRAGRSDKASQTPPLKIKGWRHELVYVLTSNVARHPLSITEGTDLPLYFKIWFIGVMLSGEVCTTLTEREYTGNERPGAQVLQRQNF